jgi:RNA-binding protein
VAKKKKPSAPLVPLTGKHKSYLRSLAHKLKPVVQIGHQGVTPGVLAAIDTALEKHELIKVKVSGEAEVDAGEIGPKLEKATKSQVAQVIGHTLVIYRRRQENPKIVLPKDKPKKKAPAKAARVEPDENDEDDFEDDLEDDGEDSEAEDEEFDDEDDDLDEEDEDEDE